MKSFRIQPLLLTLCLLLLAQQTLFAQGKNDSNIVSPLRTSDESEQPSLPFSNSWGTDILVSTNGFGLGFFYRHEYTRELAGFVDFSISESKDEREVERYDYWTGQSYVLGKENRFLVLPLFAGVQYRLFREDIMDNFRPYVNAAAGPTMVYVFPYREEYFTALGKGQPRYTVGGYLGFGAFFGSERSTLFGLNVRYYFVPFSGGIESMKYGNNIEYKNEFGGLFISLSVGSVW
jgi:hypothetical protein